MVCLLSVSQSPQRINSRNIPFLIKKKNTKLSLCSDGSPPGAFCFHPPEEGFASVSDDEDFQWDQGNAGASADGTGTITRKDYCLTGAELPRLPNSTSLVMDT